MPPVRVRVDGVFNMTRRTFLVVQAITLLVCLAAMATAIWAPFWWPVVKNRDGALTPRQRALLLLLDWLPWVALVVLVFEALKTWLVLRQFARKQAEADRARALAAVE